MLIEPVPPYNKGAGLTRSEKSNAPLPWMPSIPLCPAMVSKSIPAPFIFRFRCPAPCAPSQSKSTCLGSAFLMEKRSGIAPVTLEAAVIATSFVLGFISLETSSARTFPLCRGQTSGRTPRSKPHRATRNPYRTADPRRPSSRSS